MEEFINYFFKIFSDSLINMKYINFNRKKEDDWTLKGNKTSIFDEITGIQICTVQKLIIYIFENYLFLLVHWKRE